MPKRFTATEIWAEDWYLDMPTEYKLFWHYLLSACNHAGLFKVNVRSFCGLNGVNITPDEALRLFNSGKERIRVVKDGMWLIEDFFSFQYGTTFNPNNRVHESIENEYKKVGVKLTSIRGLIDLKDRVKDKDKDKDKDKSISKDKDSVGKKHKANETEKKSLFDSFYDGYGKKVDKAAALKAWMKINVTDMPVIIEKAKKYAATITDRQFQPYPASWLNGRRWEDEPTTNVQPSQRPLYVPTEQDFYTHADWIAYQKKQASA